MTIKTPDYSDIERRIAAHRQDPPNWDQRYYIFKDEFITCAFTLKAATEFIARRGYNYRGLGRLHVYVESMYRVPEMIAIEEYLLSHATPRVEAA